MFIKFNSELAMIWYKRSDITIWYHFFGIGIWNYSLFFTWYMIWIWYEDFLKKYPPLHASIMSLFDEMMYPGDLFESYPEDNKVSISTTYFIAMFSSEFKKNWFCSQSLLYFFRPPFINGRPQDSVSVFWKKALVPFFESLVPVFFICFFHLHHF